MNFAYEINSNALIFENRNENTMIALMFLVSNANAEVTNMKNFVLRGLF